MVSFSGTAQLGGMVRSSSSTSSMEEYRGGGRVKNSRRTDPIAVVEDCKRNEFGYFDCPCVDRHDGSRCKDRFLSVNSLYAHYFTKHYQLPGRHYCGACCIRFKSHLEREEHNYTVHFAKPQVDLTAASTEHEDSHEHVHTDQCTHSHSPSTAYSYNNSSSEKSCTDSYSYNKTPEKSSNSQVYSDKSYDSYYDAQKSSYTYTEKSYGYSSYAEENSYSYSQDYSNHYGPVHTYQVNTKDYYNSHVMKNNYNSYVDLKHEVHSGIDADNVQTVAFGAITKNANYKPSEHRLCHMNHHMSHINHG